MTKKVTRTFFVSFFGGDCGEDGTSLLLVLSLRLLFDFSQCDWAMLSSIGFRNE